MQPFLTNAPGLANCLRSSVGAGQCLLSVSLFSCAVLCGWWCQAGQLSAEISIRPLLILNPREDVGDETAQWTGLEHLPPLGDAATRRFRIHTKQHPQSGHNQAAQSLYFPNRFADKSRKEAEILSLVLAGGRGGVAKQTNQRSNLLCEHSTM